VADSWAAAVTAASVSGPGASAWASASSTEPIDVSRASARAERVMSSAPTASFCGGRGIRVALCGDRDAVAQHDQRRRHGGRQTQGGELAPPLPGMRRLLRVLLKVEGGGRARSGNKAGRARAVEEHGVPPTRAADARTLAARGRRH
jgi:hypothetical protein